MDGKPPMCLFHEEALERLSEGQYRIAGTLDKIAERISKLETAAEVQHAHNIAQAEKVKAFWDRDWPNMMSELHGIEASIQHQDDRIRKLEVELNGVPDLVRKHETQLFYLVEHSAAERVKVGAIVGVMSIIFAVGLRLAERLLP